MSMRDLERVIADTKAELEATRNRAAGLDKSAQHWREQCAVAREDFEKLLAERDGLLEAGSRTPEEMAKIITKFGAAGSIEDLLRRVEAERDAAKLAYGKLFNEHAATL